VDSKQANGDIEKFKIEKTYTAFYDSGKRVERSLAACITTLFFAFFITVFSDTAVDKIKVPILNAELSYQQSSLVLIVLGALLTLRHLLLFMYNRMLYRQMWQIQFHSNEETVWPLQYPSAAGFIAISPKIGGVYRTISIVFGVSFGLVMHFIPMALIGVVSFRSDVTCALIIVGLIVLCLSVVSIVLIKKSSSTNEPKVLAEAFDQFDRDFPK